MMDIYNSFWWEGISSTGDVLVRDMCGLFWMRPPFLGPSFIFGPVLHFWARPPFLGPSSISGPVLHFWTPPFLDLSSNFEDGTRLPLSRGSNSPSSSNGPRDSKAFFWVRVTMPGRFRMDISAEKERARLPAGVGVQGGSDLILGLISRLISFSTFLPLFTGVLLAGEGVGDCCGGRSGV
jgi:hypothetical protein